MSVREKDFVSTHSNEQLAGFINQFESQKGQLWCSALMLSLSLTRALVCEREEGGREGVRDGGVSSSGICTTSKFTSAERRRFFISRVSKFACKRMMSAASSLFIAPTLYFMFQLARVINLNVSSKKSRGSCEINTL